MKITIETNPDIDRAEEMVFNQFREWCDMAFIKYKLEIEGTNFKAVRE